MKNTINKNKSRQKQSTYRFGDGTFPTVAPFTGMD